jgi:hypothetical protein
MKGHEVAKKQIVIILALVFSICFLAPANFGFGLSLQIRISNAEREAERFEHCAVAAEMPSIEPGICPEIAHIRDVYDGMRLSELKSYFSFHLLMDKLKFAIAGVLFALALRLAIVTWVRIFSLHA